MFSCFAEFRYSNFVLEGGIGQTRACLAQWHWNTTDVSECPFTPHCIGLSKRDRDFQNQICYDYPIINQHSDTHLFHYLYNWLANLDRGLR